MAKLIISESQYNRLFKPLLNEGRKEMLLGTALILNLAMGKDMSNYNKEVANKAVADIKIMSSIKSTFEDETSLKQLADELGELGMKNPDIVLARESMKIVDEFNKIAEQNKLTIHLGVDAINNLNALNPKKEG